MVGYALGYHGASESALGTLSREVFSDNTDEWSGDHGNAADLVPGILLTNRPLKKKATRLKNLAAAILAEFGVDEFPPGAGAPAGDRVAKTAP